MWNSNAKCAICVNFIVFFGLNTAILYNLGINISQKYCLHYKLLCYLKF